MKKVTQILYYEQVKQTKHNIKAHEKWEILIGEQNMNWNKIHEIPFKCTIDTKLRYFQYKFIMRIVFTNTLLMKCRKVSSNLCDFCNRNIETLLHLFYECQVVQNFWFGRQK